MIPRAANATIEAGATSSWWSRLDVLRRGTGVWAMADQGIVSLGNFLTIIVLARSLPLVQFGAYAVLFEVVLFLNSVTASLITYPLSVKGATAGREVVRRLTGASVVMTLLLAVPLGIGVTGGALAVGRLSLAPWIIAAMVLWQVQETLRRALTCHLRFAAALPADAMSYLGQAGLLVLLVWHGHMTLELAFAAMAITSLIAGAVQWIQVKPLLPRRAELVDLSRQFWKTGYWAMLSNLTTVITIPAFAWVLGVFQGLAAVAIYQSFANLLKVANPVMSAVVNLIIPAGSRGKRDGGVGRAWERSGIYALQGAALLLPYFLALLIIPRFVIRLSYGPHSECLNDVNLMRVFVAGYMVIYISQITNAFLLSLDASRSAFIAQLSNVAACITLGLPMTALAGMPGAVWGNLVSTAARVVAGVILIRGIARRDRLDPSPGNGAEETVVPSFSLPRYAGEGLERGFRVASSEPPPMPFPGVSKVGESPDSVSLALEPELAGYKP